VLVSEGYNYYWKRGSGAATVFVVGLAVGYFLLLFITHTTTHGGSNIVFYLHYYFSFLFNLELE